VAVLLSLLTYSAYIFLDFSGYSDIAIGTAYMIGIKTPENFNAPYLSLNISDFWKRWHITFSSFLTLYVFKPIIKLLNSVIHPKRRLLVSVLGYLLTFIICGLWHGSTINFLYWGLWHGIGLAIYKIWDVKIKPNKTFFASEAYKGISIAITFIFVTVGWLFFHYSTEQLAEIFELIL
jgi:alginate O-acetyltransferase complex protein AlgI